MAILSRFFQRTATSRCFDGKDLFLAGALHLHQTLHVLVTFRNNEVTRNKYTILKMHIYMISRTLSNTPHFAGQIKSIINLTTEKSCSITRKQSSQLIGLLDSRKFAWACPTTVKQVGR